MRVKLERIRHILPEYTTSSHCSSPSSPDSILGPGDMCEGETELSPHCRLARNGRDLAGVHAGSGRCSLLVVPPRIYAGYSSSPRHSYDAHAKLGLANGIHSGDRSDSRPRTAPD